MCRDANFLDLSDVMDICCSPVEKMNDLKRGPLGGTCRSARVFLVDVCLLSSPRWKMVRSLQEEPPSDSLDPSLSGSCRSTYVTWVRCGLRIGSGGESITGMCRLGAAPGRQPGHGCEKDAEQVRMGA